MAVLDTSLAFFGVFSPDKRVLIWEVVDTASFSAIGFTIAVSITPVVLLPRYPVVLHESLAHHPILRCRNRKHDAPAHPL